jgi:hypothetical protein
MAGQRDGIARPTRGGEERSAERPPSQATPAIEARAARVLGLQLAVGNRATARLLARDDTPSLLGPTPRLHLDPQFMPPQTLSLPSLGSSLPRPGQLPPLPDLHDRQPSISDYRSPAGAGAMAPDVAARLFDFRAILQSLPQPPDAITVPADPAPDTPDPFQFQAGMQWSWSAGKAAPDRTVQLQLQRGVYILQASVNIDNGQVQWLGGINPQISTREVHFLGAVISAQAFLQVLAGVTSDRGGTMGPIHLPGRRRRAADDQDGSDHRSAPGRPAGVVVTERWLGLRVQRRPRRGADQRRPGADGSPERLRTAAGAQRDHVWLQLLARQHAQVARRGPIRRRLGSDRRHCVDSIAATAINCRSRMSGTKLSETHRTAASLWTCRGPSEVARAFVPPRASRRSSASAAVAASSRRATPVAVL